MAYKRKSVKRRRVRKSKRQLLNNWVQPVPGVAGPKPFSKYTHGAQVIPKFIKPSGGRTGTVRTTNFKMNGGGQVICTNINVGESTEKDKKATGKFMKNGVWTKSSFIVPFSVVNSATTGANQKVQDIASIAKGLAIKTVSDEAFDNNAAWAALRPGLVTAAYDADCRISTTTQELEFTNMEPTITFVRLYYFRAKKDNETPYTYDSPDTVWTTDADVNEGLNSVSRSFPGETPSGPFFKDNFHTVFKQDYCMNPGEVRRVTIYHHMNKNFNFVKTLNHQGNIKGLTHHLMMVARGPVCDNSQVQFATPTVFSLAPVKIVGTIRTVYKFGVQVRPSKTNYQATSGLTATYTGNLYNMNDDKGSSESILPDGVIG